MSYLIGQSSALGAGERRIHGAHWSVSSTKPVSSKFRDTAQNNLGKQRICMAYTSLIEGTQASRILKHRPPKKAAYWLAYRFVLVSILTQLRILCSGNGASHSGLHPPTSINNQINPPQTLPQCSCQMKQLPNLF